MRGELRAAGIHGADLEAAYRECRQLNAEHGRTYYLATLLLPPAKRPFVHALYGFARYADDILDGAAPGGPAQRAEQLDQLRADLDDAWLSGRSRHPVVLALVDTATRWQIDRSLFDAFLASMQLDLTVSSYRSYEDLREYMYGSAAVIGLQLLPILEPADPVAARAGAIALGEAFQLANFVRDVGEDLDRGRIYLPLDELARHGVTPATLATRQTDDRVRAALAEQVARVRRLSQAAAPTIALLHPSVRDCIETARVLYCGIVDEVERQDYDVFSHRATVPRSRRAAVAARAWARARRARHRSRPAVHPTEQSYPRQRGGPLTGSGCSPRRPQQSHRLSVSSTSANPKPRSSTGA